MCLLKVDKKVALFRKCLLLALVSFRMEKEAEVLQLLHFHRTRSGLPVRRGQMARDEARHGKALEGLLKRYFG